MPANPRGLNSPSVGRPRCEVTITAAPASSACWIAGTEARMRVSSVMLPASSCGTFRSARMKTRLPWSWLRAISSLNRLNCIGWQTSIERMEKPLFYPPPFPENRLAAY